MAFIGTGRMVAGDTIAWEIECDREQGIEDTNLAFPTALPTARSDYEVISAPGAKLDWFTQIPDLQATAGAEPGALRWEMGHQENSLEAGPTGSCRIRRSSLCAAFPSPPAPSGLGMISPGWRRK